MIRTVVKWVSLLASGSILLIGLSPVMQRWLDQKQLIPDQYSHGDLYNLSSLRAFREDKFETNDSLVKTDKPEKRYRDVHLYTIGDSFTNIDTTYYNGGRNVHVWVNGNKPTVAPLDTTQKNILVVEFIERILQERLYSPDFERMYIENGIVQTVERTNTSQPASRKEDYTNWLLARFGPEINQRLEFLLFNSKFFSLFKELKAQLVLNGFGRVSGAVISHNKQHLFYTSEVDTNYVLSSFRPISDQKLDTLVTNLNTIRRHYLDMGFDEVYVCLIPNKVTILEPNRGVYNHQIERIEANPRLEAPVITMIDTLRQHPEWYHLGDGHWNNEGKRFWLRHVNGIVAQWANKKYVGTSKSCRDKRYAAKL